MFTLSTIHRTVIQMICNADFTGSKRFDYAHLIYIKKIKPTKEKLGGIYYSDRSFY